MDLLFQLFFSLIVVSTSLYLLGHAITSLIFTSHKAVDTIAKLIGGILTLVVIYASIKTGFKTVFIICVIPFTLYFYKEKIKIIPSKKRFLSRLLSFNKQFFTYLTFCFIFFTLTLLDTYDLSKMEFLSFFPDYNYYALLASYFNEFGVENVSAEFFLRDKGGLTPHHYLDIWLTTIIQNVTSIHSQYILYLIIYPILFSITMLGCIRIIDLIGEALKVDRIKNRFLLSFLIITTGMLGFLYPNSIETLNMEVHAFSFFKAKKLSVIYLFGVFIVINFIQEKWRGVTFWSCILAIIYSATAPALFSALFLFYLISFKQKSISLSCFKEQVFFLLSTAIGVGAFYSLFGGNSKYLISFEQIFSLSSIQTMINIFGKIIIQLIIINLPFVVVFYLNRNLLSKYNKLLLFTGLIVFSGISIWALLWSMHDSVQLYGNIVSVFMNILLFILLIGMILSLSRARVKLAFIFLFVILGGIEFYTSPSNYNGKSLSNVNFECIKQEKPRFAFFRQPEEYDNQVKKFEFVYKGGLNSLYRKYDPFVAVCLSSNEIESRNEVEEKFVQSLTFNRYLSENEFVSIEEARLSFIREFGINYILMSNKRELPAYLQNMFKKKKVGVIDKYSIYQKIEISL